MAKQPGTIEKVHEALGVKLFRPPPDGFDPLKASKRELRLHGYPPRPDAKKQPELHALWERTLAQPIEMIAPEFSFRTQRRHGPRIEGVSDATSTNWSGSVVQAPEDDSFSWVIGQWTVPNVAPPSYPSGAFFFSSAWIGIDGFGSKDVLQAGTEQDILFFGHETYAWWEWFPDNEVAITNLHVATGDVMFCSICVDSPTEATFHMLNVTTRQATSFQKWAPKNTSLVGNCAEWIVERPTINNHLSYLPRYGDVYFDEGLAGTEGGVLFEAGQGLPLTMDEDGRNASEPIFETNELVRLVSLV